MNIAIVNKATTPIGVDLPSLVKACQLQGTRDIDPVWKSPADNLILLDDFTDQYPAIILVDDPDQANALGYHEVSPNGNPIGKIFVKTTLNAGDLISVVFSHEYQELKINPFVDKIAVNPRNKYAYAIELSDQVQAESYAVNDIPLSNFLYPSAFNPNAGSGEKFDHLGTLKAPFTIGRGGYANVRLPNGQWSQIFADQMAFEKYHSKDHDRSPQIQAAKKAFASMKLFDAGQYPVVPAY